MATWMVIAVVRERDGFPVGVYTDPSEARVRLIYIEEETKQPHRLVDGTLTLEEVPHEVAHDPTACPCTGGTR
jgi:hypothetical protein